MRKSSVCGEYAISTSVELCDFENLDFNSLILIPSMEISFMEIHLGERARGKVFTSACMFCRCLGSLFVLWRYGVVACKFSEKSV